LELKAEERASAWLGQNSTQNEQPLQRSTLMATKPLDMGTLREVVSSYVSKLHAIEDIRDLNRRHQSSFLRSAARQGAKKARRRSPGSGNSQAGYWFTTTKRNRINGASWLGAPPLLAEVG
jgi:hypothetical protein